MALTFSDPSIQLLVVGVISRVRGKPLMFGSHFKVLEMKKKPFMRNKIIIIIIIIIINSCYVLNA